jgi:tetratricopeptide (TPR) repeat protein
MPPLTTAAFYASQHIRGINVVDRHWLKQTERYLLVGSGIGTVASIAAQNVALASAPLTVLAAVGLLNRNRMARDLEAAEEKLAQRHRQISRRLTNVSKQVTALPSPEALTNFQRSVVDRNNRAFVRFAHELNDLRGHVNLRLVELQAPDLDLSAIHKDIAQLQDQYNYTCVDVEKLTTSVQRLATLPRVEAVEAKLSQLKTDLMQVRVNNETLRSEFRTTLSNLQETVTQLDHRLQDIPRIAEPTLMRAELVELTKTIADRVTQKEFASLVQHVRDLNKQQANLEQALTQIPVGPIGWSTQGAMTATGGTSAAMVAKLEQLQTNIRQLQKQVSRQETAGHTREQVQQMVSQYLGQLKAQLSQLEGVTQSLTNYQNQLTERLDQAMPAVESQAETRRAMVQLAKRLKITETALQSQAAFTQSAAQQALDFQQNWIVDLPGAEPTPKQTQKLPSHKALEAALETAQQRLLLVWPWASYVEIDDDLLNRFVRLLDRGCQLEIGWCHQGNQQEGRLTWRISQRWGIDSGHLDALKLALNRLVRLRENYPDQFKFKIMGTTESFLVCDSGQGNTPDQTYAIVGIEALPTQSVVFPRLETKLRVADPEVVAKLAQRFDHPSIAPNDLNAFFNRGTTRHDLRDQPGAIRDYNRVLSLQPDHAIALNDRGAAHIELNQVDDAEIDFTEAIAANPNLFAAYCNRGWLRLEQHRYPAAVEDFARAIELKPHLPVAYVYRGNALQKLGNLKQAVRDYSDAIACGDPIVLPYFYRSAAYQSQGDNQRAIADLKLASARLEAQGDHQALSSVRRRLNQLQSQVLEKQGR